MFFRHCLPVFALAATACGAAPDAVAQNAAPQAPRTLTVTGAGEAAAAPDMAVLSIGVETEGATAADALRDNSEKMRAVIDKLKALGVAERDIQTSGLSVNPRYDYKARGETPRLIGFVASNTVTAKLRDLEEAGAILDQTVQVGANTIRNLSFAFSDPQPLYDAARRDAVAHARSKAELLSEAAGVRLGPVLTIHESQAYAPSPPLAMARMEAAADVSVPLQGGESVVTANVTIVYEIE